jgi:hypothetical protein
VPGRIAAHQIGHAARRVQPAAHHHAHPAVPDPVLDFLDDQPVDGVLGNLPAEADDRSHHVIDEALLRPTGLNRADARLADGADLELRAVGERVGRGPQAALPVGARSAELHPAVPRIVLGKDVAGHGALHRMADIVDERDVAIGPSP